MRVMYLRCMYDVHLSHQQAFCGNLCGEWINCKALIEIGLKSKSEHLSGICVTIGASEECSASVSCLYPIEVKTSEPSCALRGALF